MRRIWLGILVWALLSLHAQAQTPQPLTQLQFDIVGIRLTVDPPVLTVPKNIATQLNTALVVPDGSGPEVAQALAAFAQGAVVQAELRGPAITPTTLTVKPGQPFPIPPFALPGDYFLGQIRLVKDGAVVMDASPTEVPIKVISEVLVTSVTARPLSLEDIRDKGIVIDENNFQVMNFQLAFNIDGNPFTINMPVAQPTGQSLDIAKRKVLLQELSAINQVLAQTVELPPEFQRPGLNFSIAALPFVPVDDGDGDAIDRFGPPPITGLLVIPGNIAFLNQFFSVLLMVTNAAPDGTPLVLRDVKATIALPTGLDRVPGTYEAPGDDPLRLARLAGVGQQASIAVVQVGPDGILGTADDLPFIPAQRMGEGEFLVEGLREGGHTMDIDIRAVLHGLPSGPVALMGKAAGAVFVRNPTFSLTLAHPRTVRSGEPYELYATITNTSQSPANLVSVHLDPRSISGAQLLSAATVQFETLPPGQSATATFSMLAQKTGTVTFASFTADPGITGSFQLRTGIGERDVPLAPNAIVLPTFANALPASLIAAAQRVLGQALSVATAPAQALPPDVLSITRQTVIERGRALGEAGQRLEFGEPLSRVVQDLLLDWLGNQVADDGFDQLLRTTNAGAQFLAEVAAILNASVANTTVLDFQQVLAQTAVSRTASLSAITGLGAGAAPVRLTITDDQGRTVGQTSTGPVAALPFAGVLPLQQQGGRADLAVVARLNAPRYTVTVTGTGSGAFDLGVVVPTETGRLTLLQYRGVAIEAGSTATVVVDLQGNNTFVLQIDQNSDGLSDRSVTPATVAVVEEAPHVVAVRQLTPADLSDPAAYGQVLGVLFDKAVTAATAETIKNYAIESNTVSGAKLQTSGRLVRLLLTKPIGTLVARSLTLSNITDARNHVLAPTTVPITTVFSDGARVFGQVRTADGQPVANALLELALLVPVGDEVKFVPISVIRTNQDGGFDFDFVLRLDALRLKAQHPETLDIAEIQARIRAPGESLLLNPTFVGKGTVRGRVLAADGTTPVPNAPVILLLAALGTEGIPTTTNALGDFVYTNVPVGTYTVRASDGRNAIGQATGVIPTAGAEARTDVVVIPNQPLGTLTGRVFRSDGSTPAVGFLVYVGSFGFEGGKSVFRAVDQAVTDAAGSFSFAQLLAGPYDVVAVDPATRQLGKTHTEVIAQVTNATSIVMEASGIVEGVVRDAQGRPVAGALIAGGTALVETDANGFFHVEGVTAGTISIEAGNPQNKRRGSATVTVLPGQTVTAAVTLEARAAIVGRVLDANGQPVPDVTVRLPQDGGYTFVFANHDGVFRLPNLPLGSYLIQAPGPPPAALIDYMKNYGIDPCSAFTAGEPPPDLHCGTDPFAGVDLNDTNAVLEVYKNAVETFIGLHDPLLVGLPAPPAGGFGWNRVQLFQDSVTVTANIQYLPQGTVSGMTVDSNSLPTGAVVRIKGVTFGQKGEPLFRELQRINTDPQDGAFRFSGIPLFDLATFQATGIAQLGDFTLQAANPFSPAIAQFNGQLNANTPNAAGIVLRFPAATDSNGTISGIVFMPDGTTPAPEGTQVQISFGDLTVTTDAQGRFVSHLPIPADNYTVTAEEPISGLRGQGYARVITGENVDVQVRLLGLGAITLTVQRPNGQVVPNTNVELIRGGFPGDRANGVTSTNGTVQFVNITEGPFSVTAAEQGTGLMGRASGVIVRDREMAATIIITAAGRVTGTFVAADGRTPIPNAQIVLTTAQGVQAFTQTDATGRFALLAIPVGAFTLEGNDPLTRRLGRANGQLRFEGDATDVTILQLPRGTVEGVVLQADGVTPIPGANITIAANSFMPTQLQATTRNDGSFRFEGVSAGTFTLTATDPVSQFTGHASGTLTREGEVVTQNVFLEGFGAIRARVFAPDGTPVGNAALALFAGDSLGTPLRQATVDVNGEFTFTFLQLGKYRLVAQSLAESHNGAETTVTIAEINQTAEARLDLRGVGDVEVLVVASDGVTPVPSAQVTLNASAASGNEPPRPFGGSFLAFTNASGRTTIPEIPRGDFFVTAEAGTVSGVSTGRITVPDEVVAITVELGESGAIRGRVLLPDGSTPAAQALVTLTFPSQSSLQSGVLQVTTDLSGIFNFTGIPLGPFTINALEVVSSGVNVAAGTLSVDGQQLDLGTLILDNTAPRVVAVTPADGSSGVSVTTPIVVTFSEPMQPGTFNYAQLPNFLLVQGATPVEGALLFANNNQTVTFTPKAPLTSNALYTILVKAVPDGPRDVVNLSLLNPFVSSFRVQDIVPPTVVSSSPAPGEQQVLPEAVVRITFSETIASTLRLTLRDATGQSVAGRVDLALGNSVAIFTPSAFLPPNTSYTMTVEGVTDLAGNPLASGPFTTQFATVDTRAPVLNALRVLGNPMAGTRITVQPDIADTDVARVEYLISGQTPQVASLTPFAAAVSMPVGVATVEVTAVAVDKVGNRSTPQTLTIPVSANQPPTVTLTNLSGATAAQGQTLSLQITASDDVALQRLVFSTVGAVTTSQEIAIPNGQAQFSTSVPLTVPLTAVSSGSFTVQVAAVDSIGNLSVPATLALQVQDGIQPTVMFNSPVQNAQVIPGQPVDVVLTASDDVAVASISLVCSPALSGCGTRVITPGVPNSTQTLTLQIPATLAAPATVSLMATAQDTAGNTSAAVSRTLQIADTVAPAVNTLQSLSGATRVLAGQTVTIQAHASDNVAVTTVEFDTTGALVQHQTVAIAPPAKTATANLTVTVPATAPNGGSLTVTARARDAAGNVSADGVLALQIGDLSPPTVAIVTPSPNSQVAPGQNVTVTVQGSDDVAVQQIMFEASGVLSAHDARLIDPAGTPATVSFVVPVPAGTLPGTITFAVTAQDTAGNVSATVHSSITVIDNVAPTVQITSPLANAAIDPRSPLPVTVTATDNVGVTVISLTATGVISTSETRPINPATPSATQSFTIAFPSLPPSGGALTINATARDAAVNQGTAASVTVSVRDVVPPTVATVTPPHGATQVPLDTAIVVQFSEPMDRSTVTSQTLHLLQGDTNVPVTVTFSAGDQTVSLTPVTPPLQLNATYTLRIDPGVTDRAGNALTVAFTSTFSTGSPDVTPPQVASVAPANGSTDFPVNGVVIVRFTEPLQPASVVSGTVRLFQGGTEVTGSVTLSDDQLSITFTPAQPLAGQAVHVVQVQGVSDAAGNRMTALFKSTFTTAEFRDTESPTVLRTSPEYGQADVPVNAPFTVQFSERMDPATLIPANFIVQDTVTGQNVPGMVQVDPEGRTASFVPTQPFAVGRLHYVYLTSGIQDAAGNSLSLFYYYFYYFYFTTSFVLDNDNPRLVATSPVDGDAQMPLNTLLMLEFSEPLHTVNVLSGIQVLVHGASVPGSIALSNGNRRLTFTPAGALQANTLHEVVVTTQITDLVGHPLDNPGRFTFATGDTSDVTPPTVLAIDPAPGAVEVPTNALVHLSFSERLNPLTVTTTTFLVQREPDFLPIAGHVTVAPDGRSATFTPSQPLAHSTQYHIQAFGLSDLAGQGTSVFTYPTPFTTGEAADTEPPQVVAVSPPDGTTAVPANAHVVVRLSEPLSAVSVQSGVLTVTAEGVLVEGAVSLDSTRTTLTFTPSAPLTGDTTYEVAVSGLTDLGGNAVVPFGSRFITGLQENNLARAAGVTTNVSSFYPGYGPERAIDGNLDTSWFTAVGDAVNQGTTPFFEIVLPGDATVTALRLFGNREFADGFDFLSGIFQLFDSTGTLLFESGVVTLPAPTRDSTVPIANIAGVRRVRFTATADESVEPGFAELEVIGRFADQALSGFTDTRVPQLVLVQVLNGRIVLTFDEVLDPTTVTNTTLPIGPSDFSSVLAGTYVVEGTVVTFIPTTPLPATVFVQLYGVQDLAGNSSFVSVDSVETDAGADITPPSVVLVTPSDGATDVGPQAQVVLTFSESLNPTTVNTTTVALFANGQQLSASVSHSADTRTVLVHASLPAASVITVVATHDVQDLAGNRLDDFVSHFHTAPQVDGTRPAVVGQQPANGAMGVALTARVVLYTTEALEASTIPGAVFVSQNGVLVRGTTTVRGAGRVLEFVPETPWQPEALIQVFLTSQAQDRGGNRLFDYQGSFRTVADPRTTAPSVVRTSPAQGATLPRNGVIEVEFNEPLDPTTVTPTTVGLVPYYGGSPVASTVSLVPGERVVRLVPSTLLDANMFYLVTLSTEIRDQDGQAVAAVSYYFVTEGRVDTVPPGVVAVTPPDGVSQVGLNANLRVRLSEPINPVSVTETTLVLNDEHTASVPYTVSFSEGDREVLLVPQVPLAAATRYSLTVAGLTDLAGNLVVPQTTQFTTDTEPDTTAPDMVRVSPTTGTTGVPVNVAYRAEFTEPMDAGNVNSSSFWVVDSTTGQNVTGTLSLSANGRAVSFVPAAPLAVGRFYNVFLAGLRDLAGNSSAFRSFNFTTAFAPDTTAPHLVGVSPADGLNEVPINTRVVIAFDEPVQTLSVDQVTLRTGGVEVPMIRNLSDGNQTLTLLPVVPLAPRTAHTVTIAGVQDLAGNPLAAVVTTTFTTEAGADLLPPQVLAIDPAPGAVEVPTNALVHLSFSERLNPLTVTTTTFLVQRTSDFFPIAGHVTVASDGRSATFTSSQPLAHSTQYYVQAFGLTDLVGQVANVSTYFITGEAANTTPPQVMAVSPPDGTTAVPTNAHVVVRLNEPISAVSVQSSVLTVTAGGVSVAGTVSLDSSSTTLTFTPRAPLAGDTTFTVAMNGGTDLAGLAVLPFTSHFTTGAAGVTDTRAPQLVAVQVLNGHLVLTFDEGLDPTTATTTTLPIFASDFSGVLAGTYVVEENVVTFIPTTPLPATVVINGSGVRDVVGNSTFVSATMPTGAVADTTPPRVVLVTPSDGAMDVGPQAQVVLTFSETLNPTTVNGTTMALFANGQQLGASVSYSADTRTVLVRASLPAASVITVVATNDVQDLAGNRLEDFESSFTTTVVDVQQPQVVSQRPSNGAMGVALTARVVLYTTEALEASTIAGALFVSQNGGLVQGTTTVTGAGRVLEFVPETPWQPEALIQVFLTSQAQDRGGNHLIDYQGSFRTIPDPRTTAPAVVRTSPAQGATLPRNGVIEVEFNEPLDPTTVTPTTVSLVPYYGGDPVASTVRLVPGERVLRLVPSALLDANTFYLVILSPELRDQAGQAVAALSYPFYTEDRIDTVPPGVVAVTPPDGASQLGLNASLRVRLSEPVNPVSVTEATLVLSDGHTASVPCTVSFSEGEQEVVLVPQEPLAAATRYSLTVAGLTDLAGNLVVPQTTQFTTNTEPDTTAPQVVRVNPSVGTEGPLNVVVTLEVNEPIDPSTVDSNSFLVWDYGIGQSVAGSYVVRAGGRVVSFVPDTLLTGGHQYTVFFNGGILDLAGNPLAGANFTFTTGTAVDITRPQVVGVSPADTMVEVPINAWVVIAFDEPIQIPNADQVTLHDGMGEVEVIRQLSADHRLLTIRPVVLLTPQTVYSVIIAGVEDLAGNALTAAVTTTFTTEAGTDLLPLQVSVAPTNGAVNVPTNAVVDLQFNEPINPLTVTSATFMVLDGTTFLPLAGSVTVAADGLRATFTPSQPLTPSTQYIVEAFSLTDLVGQATSIFTSFTTGVQ